MSEKKKAVIIGAGPAGITAAYELANRTDIQPIVFEKTDTIGGIAKSIHYKQNNLDFGPHRYFSKSERVMQWIFDFFPLQSSLAKDDLALGRTIPLSSSPAADPETTDHVMLVRHRLSRIFYLRKFFDYPISLNMATLRNLGVVRVFRIGLSYLWSCLFQIKPEKSLEDFMVNRFGRELYRTFFRDYTTKVWGISPSEITPDWGAQRIRGVSIRKVILHALTKMFRTKKAESRVDESSLIEWFYYPKKGSGHLWEEVARSMQEQGGELHMGQEVICVSSHETRVTSVTVKDKRTGEVSKVAADYVISTMPVKHLISAFGADVPARVCEIAEGLCYRDGIVVGVCVDAMCLKNQTSYATIDNVIPDVWIYIQDNDVRMGRVQIYNNWSPYILQDSHSVWIAAEYFCNEGDHLWSMTNQEMIDFAIDELCRIGLIRKDTVKDSMIDRMKKTYPAYFGTYDYFNDIRSFTDQYENLFLIGRNGMHRYNNMDHSMLTAMVAVDMIAEGCVDKEMIWSINTDDDYHEQK